MSIDLAAAAGGGRPWDPSLSIDEIERRLAAVWEQTLRKGPVRRDDQFHRFGADCAVELLWRVEARFGRRLPLSTFFTGGSTVAGMARALIAAENPANSTTEPALVVLQPQGSRPPICWLPGGSGLSALSVRSVSLLLGPDQPVYALETPVRPEGPFDLRRRATAYVEALRARLAPPYWLFGFSYGAWMALEMARQIGAIGAAVKQLVVFDAAVPRDFTARERALKAAQHLRWHLQRARSEPLKELARLANGLLRRTGLIAAQAQGDPTLPPGSVYNVVDRAVRAGIRDYAQEPQPPWSGRITLVLGERREWPGMAGELDLRMGWRNIAGGGFNVIRVPGEHLSMLEGAEADDLAAKLRGLLETGAVAL